LRVLRLNGQLADSDGEARQYAHDIRAEAGLPSPNGTALGLLSYWVLGQHPVRGVPRTATTSHLCFEQCRATTRTMQGHASSSKQ
jgi:hypothetical protein